MADKKNYFKSATYENKINKNDIYISVRQRRIDVMRNGNWIGKTYWYGTFNFNPHLNTEEYNWIEQKIRSHFN